jgi:protein-export membrane protein SecD
MQRVLPFVVLALFLAALAFSFVPMNRPFAATPERMDTRLGLDLVGGLRGEYQVVATDAQPVTPEILAQTRTIIENRVNAFGVAEPVVQTQGADRISVELPGATDEEQLRRLIGSTGVLEFVPVPPQFRDQVFEGAPLPPGMADVEPLFTGVELAAARPGVDDRQRPAVFLELKETGARLFDEYAAQNLGERFAIVLDNIVQSAPVLQARRFGGQAQISGSFTPAEVNSLVTVLRFGSLPLEIREVGFSSLSATLGLEFLNHTVLAGLIGVLTVFAFMLIHYRLPGVVACLALVFYALLVYAVFRLVPVTLTLAGIAAFILSVGMAVDANILIFERTREELRSGKTLASAVETGFSRAWNSILDSNVSTILVAGILWYFGTSVVKGFALVLIIGVLISMFTAFAVSRMMLRWVARQPTARRAWLFGVAEDEFLAATPRGRGREVVARV